MEEKFYYDGVKIAKDELGKTLKKDDEEFKKNPDQRLVPVFKMLEGKEILDVGCGVGEITKYVSEKNFNVHGIDVLEESIKIAKEFNNTKNTSFEVRDLIKQPFSQNSFDCVIFLETIEHVENPAEFLREFHKILRPEGCIILSTPNATSLKNIAYALSHRKNKKQKKIISEISNEQKNTGTQLEHIFNWDFPTLVRLLDKCGFDVVEHEFARSGPIIIPIFGKKVEIIKLNSKILNPFSTLKTTHVMKARKKKN
jgi:ubiquinone biosynthesis O-methyltransferase